MIVMVIAVVEVMRIIVIIARIELLVVIVIRVQTILLGGLPLTGLLPSQQAGRSSCWDLSPGAD